ncbi:MAG TPA: 5-formyltetrahydrofolate cyclo-ligase [Actinocrinis sp.]|nr:5-formyltetrahydrofolate cyclo-ligase [Actinocrinis sp.]
MPESANDKATVRSRFVNDRLTLGNYALSKASSALVQRLLQTPELRVYEPDHDLTVCAYASFGTEPDTTQLIETLSEQGVRVLLPVLMPNADLDWAVYDARFESGRFGLREPAGERLGTEAILDADVVLVPALAVSDTGYRLGRGGGSYDRALGRLMVRQREEASRPRPWICALVYDHELAADFPVEPHDQPVDAACAPSRLVRFTQPEAG